MRLSGKTLADASVSHAGRTVPMVSAEATVWDDPRTFRCASYKDEADEPLIENSDRKARTALLRSRSLAASAGSAVCESRFSVARRRIRACRKPSISVRRT